MSNGSPAAVDPYELPRRAMIEGQLRRRGVVRHSVLEAMREVPRHLFVAHAYADRAYADEALPSTEGQTISQPFIVGLMTQELDVRRGQKVLELGTGTGYQTAILAKLVGPEGRVFTIERIAGLAASAQRRLEAMEVRNVQFWTGDGSAGWPEAGVRFDRVLIAAGAPQLPEPVVEQLTAGGVIVAPVGAPREQRLVRGVRTPEGLAITELLACRFVPLLGEHAWAVPEAL